MTLDPQKDGLLSFKITCVSPGTKFKFTFLMVKGEIADVNFADAVNLCWSIPLCVSIVLQSCFCVKIIYCTCFTKANAVGGEKYAFNYLVNFLHYSVNEKPFTCIQHNSLIL